MHLRTSYVRVDSVPLLSSFTNANLQAMFLPCSIVLISPALAISLLVADSVCYIRLVLGNLAAWVHGASIVYPSAIFDPSSIVDAVVQEKCTGLHGVPTHFLGVLAEIEKRHETGERPDLSSLRCVSIIPAAWRSSHPSVVIALASRLGRLYRRRS